MSKSISKKNFQELTRGVAIMELDFLERQQTQNLNNLAIQVSPGIANFSFKQLDLDREFIQNPNILENNKVGKLTNKGINIENRFSELEDPIYDFDEAPDISVPTRRREFKNSKNFSRRIKNANKKLNNNLKRY